MPGAADGTTNRAVRAVREHRRMPYRIALALIGILSLAVAFVADYAAAPVAAASAALLALCGLDVYCRHQDRRLQ